MVLKAAGRAPSVTYVMGDLFRAINDRTHIFEEDGAIAEHADDQFAQLVRGGQGFTGFDPDGGVRPGKAPG